MRIINLTITDAEGTKIVPYCFADDGKVLIDRLGSTVTCVESELIGEYTEITIPTDEGLTADEALDIILGGSE